MTIFNLIVNGLVMLAMGILFYQSFIKNKPSNPYLIITISILFFTAAGISFFEFNESKEYFDLVLAIFQLILSIVYNLLYHRRVSEEFY